MLVILFVFIVELNLMQYFDIAKFFFNKLTCVLQHIIAKCKNNSFQKYRKSNFKMVLFKFSQQMLILSKHDYYLSLHHTKYSALSLQKKLQNQLSQL